MDVFILNANKMYKYDHVTPTLFVYFSFGPY